MLTSLPQPPRNRPALRFQLRRNRLRLVDKLLLLVPRQPLELLPLSRLLRLFLIGLLLIFLGLLLVLLYLLCALTGFLLRCLLLVLLYLLTGFLLRCLLTGSFLLCFLKHGLEIGSPLLPRL